MAVYDGSDNLLQRFEYADGRTPVSMTMSGATYALAHDQVGSLRIVADSAGNVVKRIDYDTFGNIITDTNSSLTVPLGFADGLHDRDTGLVRFGYRDYDPDTGRWTAKDPIGFAGGDTDLYGYVKNNPVNWIDPWGLEGWSFMQAHNYIHNQSIAHLQPGYKQPPLSNRGAPISDGIKVGGNIVIDQPLQLAAVNLTSKYISPAAGVILNRINLAAILLGLEPFPPPAGGLGDMILIPLLPMPEGPPPAPEILMDSNPCE